MRRHVLVTVVLALAGVLTFTAPALASPAQSARSVPRSTPNCTRGVYTGYCGTQTDLETPPMSMVSGGPPAQNRFVYAKPNSTTSPLTDFFWFQYNMGTSYIAEFAPDGVASNYCVAQVSYLSGLKLRRCNGSEFQRWIPIPVTGGNVWTNMATGNIIQSNGEDMQLRGVEPLPVTLPYQIWHFVH